MRSENGYICNAMTQHDYTFASIGAVMAHHAAHAADAVFLVYYDENRVRTEQTYGQFVHEAQQTATLLAEHGIRNGSRVAIAGHNHPDTIIAYFACWMLGACAVPLNMSEDDDRLLYILENSGATVVMCRTAYINRVHELRGQLHVSHTPVIIEQDSETIAPTYPSRLASLAPHPLPPLTANMLEDECLIVYTSGTTGNPKGVVLIQRNLFADGLDIAAWHGITADQRMLCVLPVHHVNGTIVTHVTPFLAGASVVLLRKFQTDTFFPTIRSEGVHVVSVVPTLLAFLLDADAQDLGVQKAGFRHIICGAGPLTCELADAFERRYEIPIMHGYGLSETTCYSCFIPTDLAKEEHRHWMQDFGFPTIGVPIPSNEMAIHDEQGKVLGPNERGEIVIRGANVMKEYYANEKANADAFTHGWFRSGDEGFYVEDDAGRPYFFITGRLKELIIRGGVNLAPLEIDEIICRAPGVRAGICVGFENSMYGEEVGALVIRRDERVSEEDILRYCKEHLPFHKSPKVVLFTDALPVTSTGKYQRNKVKHLFAQWKNEQFRR
ncbi:AMP-binding protein [soil metagenome]